MQFAVIKGIKRRVNNFLGIKKLTNEKLSEYGRGTITVKQREGENLAMAYSHTNSKGVKYYLNSKNVTLRGGKKQTIYYFSKDERPEAVSAVPAGFVVNENPRNGFLTVKRA